MKWKSFQKCREKKKMVKKVKQILKQNGEQTAKKKKKFSFINVHCFCFPLGTNRSLAIVVIARFEKKMYCDSCLLA